MWCGGDDGVRMKEREEERKGRERRGGRAILIDIFTISQISNRIISVNWPDQ